MCFVPVILLAGVLPITFAGIGVRDYLLFVFLGATIGNPIQKERIAALSLILLILALQSAALGGLIYLGYKPGRRNPSSASNSDFSTTTKGA